MYRVTVSFTNTKGQRESNVAYHRSALSAIVAAAETKEFLETEQKCTNVETSREKEKLTCNNLVLEVGRKCNMMCAHCLRGNAENHELYIGKAIQALNLFDSIGSLTFTGGEPTLYTDKIIQIIDYIIGNEVPVGSFYVASNGANLSLELMMAFCKLYAHCDEKEFCSFEVSRDHYHDDIDIPDYLQAFSFFGTRGENVPEAAWQHEGRAIENGIGNRTKDYGYKFDYDEEFGCVDLVYVNSFGKLYSDCDYSYESQREILAYSLDDITHNLATPQEIFSKTFKEEE